MGRRLYRCIPHFLSERQDKHHEAYKEIIIMYSQGVFLGRYGSDIGIHIKTSQDA
jgi:hypothetical protein